MNYMADGGGGRSMGPYEKALWMGAFFAAPDNISTAQQAVEGGSGGFFWLGLLLLAALLAVHWFSPLNSFSLISVSSAGIGGRGVWAM